MESRPPRSEANAPSSSCNLSLTSLALNLWSLSQCPGILFSRSIERSVTFTESCTACFLRRKNECEVMRKDDGLAFTGESDERLRNLVASFVVERTYQDHRR